MVGSNIDFAETLRAIAEILDRDQTVSGVNKIIAGASVSDTMKAAMTEGGFVDNLRSFLSEAGFAAPTVEAACEAATPFGAQAQKRSGFAWRDQIVR